MPAPVLFVSVGSPGAASRHPQWRDALNAWGRRHVPRAVIVMSARSSARSLIVSSNPSPPLVHDYVRDPAGPRGWASSGEPELARRTVEILQSAGLEASEDPLMGLDHGAWIPLQAIWPDTAVKVVAMSIIVPSSPRTLMEAGRALKPLRDEGVALIGTGRFVHNSRQLSADESDSEPAGWARNFEQWVIDRIRDRGDESLLKYRELAPAARLALPSEEQISPLHFVLGARRAEDEMIELYRGFHFGNASLSVIGFE